VMALRCAAVAVASLCIVQSEGMASLHRSKLAKSLVEPIANLRVTPPALIERTVLAAKKKVKLEIHYETLCPYCSELIGTSLQPIWKDPDFSERIEISMFPAGNVLAVPIKEVSDGFRFFHPELENQGFGHVFQCQHGEQECLGNMVQACVIKLLENPSDYLPFLFCMESPSQESSVEKTAFECLKESKISPDEILNCTQSPSANSMMFAISNYSNSLTPQRQYVPWVTINGDHQEEADGGDLLGPLCRALDAPLPAACGQTGDHHGKGVFGKLGHWMGAVEEAGSVGPRSNTTTRFCYP